MEDVNFVQCLECVNHLNSKSPNILLRNHLFSFAKTCNIWAEIAAFSKFSNHTEGGSSFLIESLLVADDVRTGDTGEDSDFVERVGDFSVVGGGEFNFFKCVGVSIFFAFDLVDGGESSFSDFADDLKVVHFSFYSDEYNR